LLLLMLRFHLFVCLFFSCSRSFCFLASVCLPFCVCVFSCSRSSVSLLPSVCLCVCVCVFSTFRALLFVSCRGFRSILRVRCP
jgi:hypothetical protein